VQGLDDLIPDRDMLHIPGLGYDGIKGLSVISYARESIGSGLAAQKFGGRFFGSGANMGGTLEHPTILKPEAYERLKNSWNENNSGIGNSHKTTILEHGTKYTRIGIPPNDAQFIETRKFSVADICRWYGVPPHLVYDLEKATFSNIEHQGLEYVIYSLLPWSVKIEQEYNRKIFTEAEKGHVFVEHNMDALLRGDAKTRSEFYRKMVSISSMSPDEVRAKENMPPLPDNKGKEYYIMSNMININQAPGQNNNSNA